MQYCMFLLIMLFLHFRDSVESGGSCFLGSDNRWRCNESLLCSFANIRYCNLIFLKHYKKHALLFITFWLIFDITFIICCVLRLINFLNIAIITICDVTRGFSYKRTRWAASARSNWTRLLIVYGYVTSRITPLFKASDWIISTFLKINECRLK